MLGCLIDSSLAKRALFDLDVLQLIGLAYLVASMLYPLPTWGRLVCAALLLTGHWAAIRFIHVPGIGAGAFAEGNNLIAYIDRIYLQQYHLKGLVSVIPTAALVLIGSAIGDILRDESTPPMSRVVALLATGSCLAAFGMLWSYDLPFNKPVWTASFILYTAGMGTIILGFFYLFIDVRGWRMWSFPFVVFGSNAIMAYILPILVKTQMLQVWSYELPNGSHLTLQQAIIHFFVITYGRVTGGWLYTAIYILIWWLVLLLLYRKKIFLRV
jgi:predicted acyltransferase